MSHPAPQDLKSHARYVPLFHFVALPILMINLVYSIVLVVKSATWDNIDNALVAVAIVIIAFAARVFALAVQDRVIRLEESLRFERVFPPDLRIRIPEFTRDQFVALRFASDHELPALARVVLDQRLTDKGEIKKMVKEWRGDHLRA
jgi:hypothetical protein